MSRCGWASSDPLYLKYHDEEWGVPLWDDLRLFELLTLEGAQAGLSWLSILRRREGYREAFEHFDVARVASFGEEDRGRLYLDNRIIRNRAKIRSTVSNAAQVLAVQDEWGSLATYLWHFVEGRPVIHHYAADDDVPADTPLSHTVSRDLKRRGFTFVGPLIIQSLLQAAGLVMDHVISCDRYAILAKRSDSGSFVSIRPGHAGREGQV